MTSVDPEYMSENILENYELLGKIARGCYGRSTEAKSTVADEIVLKSMKMAVLLTLFRSRLARQGVFYRRKKVCHQEGGQRFFESPGCSTGLPGGHHLTGIVGTREYSG